MTDDADLDPVILCLIIVVMVGLLVGLLAFFRKRGWL